MSAYRASEPFAGSLVFARELCEFGSRLTAGSDGEFHDSSAKGLEKRAN